MMSETFTEDGAEEESRHNSLRDTLSAGLVKSYIAIQYNPAFTLLANAKTPLLVIVTTKLILAFSHYGYSNHHHQDLFQT